MALDTVFEWDGEGIPTVVTLFANGTLEPAPASDKTTLVIVTADKIADTGTVSFKFMFDSKPPRDILNKMMGAPFGYFWQPANNEESYSFNVWQSGEGLKVGGGFGPNDSADWKAEMAKAIPSCTFLMQTSVFEWLKVNIFEPYGIEYVRHHSPDILATS